MRGARDGEGNQSLEAANAVFFVYDEFAFAEISGFGEEDVGFFLLRPCSADAFAEYVLFA